ncbi:Component of the cap-binding complex (CBC) [Clonorchis sinensis]|uniref:Component of the cap-binding complex (CBC) n=1 Tax=Clonorchis sinensis TaxID=79923 RepID=A0A8T1M3Z0_CLOSI|nr:Component of the cap-binding complex (CBC) [Clonorchis sinensis]
MRRRRPSDSDEEDHYSKRDRLETDTVESLIYRVGSKDTANIEKDLSDLASLILLEIPRNGDKLIKVLSRCVRNIPERVVIYATMVGLLNLKNRSFVNQLIETLQRDLKDAVKSSYFEDAKYILLFLAVSINCFTVTVNSILSLYENFAEVTLDVGRSSQCRTDWYAYAILYSLPYSAQAIATHDVAALTDILGTIDVYMTKRQKNHVPLLRVWETDDPHPQEDYLDCLWAQIRSMRASGWQEKVSWRLYDSFPSLKELGQPHHIPPLTPPDYDPEVVYPMPRVVFRMFDYTDVIEQDDDSEPVQDADLALGQPKSKEPPVLPGAHTIERFLIDEQLTILMNNLSFNRVWCAKSMLSLRTRARVALDYMIVEVVFAGMFNLPYPPVQHGNLLFYGSLLIQLCQEASNSMPLVLAQATELLYERLNTMKPVCIGRMIEWFSYHLSNYQLQWSWREWSGAISEDPMSPHRRLITETFARLIRFSYYENVKRLLPKVFYPLLPPQPVVVNKYDAKPDLPSAAAFHQVLNAMRARSSASDVLKLTQRVSDLDRLPSPSATEDDEVEHEGGMESSEDERGGPASDEDMNGTEGAQLMDRAKNRPHLVARRRLFQASQRKASTSGGEEGHGPEGELMSSTETASQLTDLSHGVTSLLTELFFSALFIAGHKTISHTFSYIKKYASAIRTIASTVEIQVEALHVLQAVWINHPQMIVIITEHMCRSGLIDPEAIVRWAYSPIMTSLTEIPIGYNPAGARPRILDFYVWECLNRTFMRVGRRVTRITNRLNAAKELMETEGLRSVSPGSERRDKSPDDDDDDDENDKRQRLGSTRRPDRRNAMAGYEMVSSENEEDEDDALFGGKGSSGSRVARLEEARCEAVRSQCAVITLLLHRHACLTSELAAEIAGDDLDISSVSRSSTALLHSSGLKLGLSKQALQHIAFWLKGRLVQVVLEHCDQLMPYLDNLDEFICGAHPEVQDVFQQLRALHS